MYDKFSLCTPLLLIFSFAGASLGQEQAKEDAAQINAASRKYSSNEYRLLFQPYSFGTEFDEKVNGYREHLNSLKAFESDELPEIKELLSTFESRYGTDQESIRKSFQEINRNGGAISGDPAYAWAQLKKVVESPAETRKKMADELNRLGSTGGQTAQGYERMTVEESYARAKEFLKLAIAYQPDHLEASETLAEIDGEQSDRLASDEKAIDDAEFPPHARSFQGDAVTMEKAVFEYLSTRNVGHDGDLLAVRIAGDWKPYDTLLDVTINWGLPIEAAYRSESDPKTADVISMKLISQDEEPEAPFQRFVITGDRQMRVENLPTEKSSRTSSTGFRMLRLPLSLCLMMLGVVAAGPWLGNRIGLLSSITEKVTPHTAMIGIVTLAFGSLSLLFSLFSPFQDFIPILSAIVIGLVVGLDLFLTTNVSGESTTKFDELAREESVFDPSLSSCDDEQRSVSSVSNGTATTLSKARKLVTDHQASIEKLKRFRMPMGVGCFVIGFVHLFAGGVLFI